MANGPSLKKDLENHAVCMMSCDRLAVNFAGMTNEYQVVKPTCYVLADPVFFSDPVDLSSSSREKVAALIDAFVNKTTWSMTLVTLGMRQDSHLIKSVKLNPKITVLGTFNGVPVPPDIRDFSGWIRNKYSPPAENIINMALYLGIVWKYSEIYLIGADTSFHEMVHVEQDTNRLYILDKHFYGEERHYMYIDPGQTTSMSMSRFLRNVMWTFTWYDKLREFADWAGVKIVNASSFSWIDAFERPVECSHCDASTEMPCEPC